MRGENQGGRQILETAIASVCRPCVVCRRVSSVAHDRWYRPWPAIDGTVRGPGSMALWTKHTKTISNRTTHAIDGSVRGPRSMAPSVARDRWHRPWPAIDGTPGVSQESPGNSLGSLPGVSRRLSWRDSRRLSGDFPGESPGDYDYDADYEHYDYEQ